MINHQNFQHIPDNHVSHSLLCRVLGIRTTSQAVLCTSKRINKWSYYKPVRSSLRGELTADKRRQMFFDANDGFDIPAFDSPKKAVEALESGAAKWTYNKPRGRVDGELEWFRIDDFAGYYSSSLQGDWFKGWSGIEKGTYANTYNCILPNTPVVNFYDMIENFEAWPEMQTSDGRVFPYRVGFLAWMADGTSKKAYFVNFGKLAVVKNNRVTIDTTSANVPLGVDLKIAPVVTSYGFGSDEPGITDPARGLDGEYVATWNECSLGDPVGSNSEYFFKKGKGWWIMPVEPVNLRFADSGTSTRPDLPSFVKVAKIVDGYPKYEPVDVEGKRTGYRVRLQMYVLVEATEGDVDVRVAVYANRPQSYYIFETKLKQQAGAFDLPFPESPLSYYGGDAFYIAATHELEIFVPKENYQNNGTIQVEVNVRVDSRSVSGERDLRPAPYKPDPMGIL